MAQTNINGKFLIAVAGSATDTPDYKNADLTEAEFKALAYEEVPDMGQLGDTGVSETFVNYPVWGNRLARKQKGAAEGEEPEARFVQPRSGGEADGLKALLAASATQNNVAIKIEWEDGHVEYDRGIVRSPMYSKGENQAFREVVFAFGLNQFPVLSNTDE